MSRSLLPCVTVALLPRLLDHVDVHRPGRADREGQRCRASALGAVHDLDIGWAMQVGDFIALDAERAVVARVEYVRRRHHLFYAGVGILGVPENIVRDTASNSSALGQGISGDQDILAVDFGQHAHVSLGMGQASPEC